VAYRLGSLIFFLLGLLIFNFAYYCAGFVYWRVTRERELFIEVREGGVYFNGRIVSQGKPVAEKIDYKAPIVAFIFCFFVIGGMTLYFVSVIDSVEYISTIENMMPFCIGALSISPIGLLIIAKKRHTDYQRLASKYEFIGKVSQFKVTGFDLFLICVWVGFAIGFSLADLKTLGINTSWKPIPLPQNQKGERFAIVPGVDTFVVSDQGRLYAHISDLEQFFAGIYGLARVPRNEKYWQEVADINSKESILGPIGKYGKCSSENLHPEYYIPDLPGRVIEQFDCNIYPGTAPDMNMLYITNRYRLIILENGEIWQWSIMGGLDNFVLYLIHSVVGLIGGGLVGLSLLLITLGWRQLRKNGK
jgi:hypothetical protein